MGRRNVIKDDWDDKELPEDTNPTVVVLDGTEYEVFLSVKSKEGFVKFLKGENPVGKPRRRLASKSSVTTGTNGEAGTKKPIEKYGHEFADVRAWAIAEGKTNSRNQPFSPKTKRLPQEIFDEYNAAHLVDQAAKD